MGDAAVRMKVMPVSMDVDLKKLAEEIKKVVPSFARLHAIEEMPIAFGLKALIVVPSWTIKEAEARMRSRLPSAMYPA
jgi:elongation factor 1-beta